MSDLTRAHQHPHAPQPQPQQPLGHHHPQPLPHHLHHYGGGNGAANANTTTPTLAHANKRYGVSVPPVVLGNSTHDAPSPYGSAMYGSLYAHQQALKDRMEYAFHQQQQQQQYNGGSQQSHGQPSQGNQGYYANPAAYSMQQDAGLSFGVQDTASQQPQAPPPHHHSLGMPQLPEMQLPPQHHDGNKDVDGVRKFRPLGGSMYLGSPSVYGTTTGADQRTTATTSASDSYMSSIRYQHQQQQQQQQQQQNIGAYRPMMHSYNAQATSQPSSHGSTTTSTFYANQTSRLSHQAPDLMTPAMAAAATAVAHGLRSAGVGSSTPTLPQNISARLTREMDNTVRIQNSQQSVQVAAVNNHQQHQHQPQQQQPPPQQQQQPQQQPQQSQPQQQQDVVCSFCYGPQCDRVAEGCGHRFHQGCLQAWGEKSFTCPLCIGSQNQMKAVTPTNGSYSQMPQNQSSMQGYQGTSLDLSGARGSADLPPTPASSALAAAARQRSRVQQRPPPIDTTRSLDSMPVSKINISNNSNVSTPGGGQTTPSSGTVSRPTSATSSSGSVDGKRSSRSKGKKPLKECSIPGCGRTVRSRGLCKGHGGGRRCGFPGCGLSDQGGGFCISHGGGKRCQFESCENSAQSRGLCKLHGGGSRCTVPNCTKSSQGRGLCRAHGGGRRCMIEGCNKTDRRAGYCVTHGADKKCVVPECSKTGRIDGMCTKHYFERNQAVLASQAQHAMMAAAAASKASRDELRNKKKAAPKPGAGRSKTSQLTPATSPTTPSLLNSLNAVSLLSSATAASAATVGGGMHGDTASGGLGLDI